MVELRDDVRPTTEDIAEDARRLAAIEGKDGALALASPRAASLSDRAEELAAELYRKSLAERDLVDTAAGSS